MTDYQPIVDAINGLQSSPYKDFVLPISTVLFSTILGLGASIYTNNFQDTINAERHKLQVINNTTLAVVAMRNNLVSIKSIYQGRLTASPIERMLTIPPLINTFHIPNINISDLTFITDYAQKEVEKNKWVRIEFIENLFNNYKNSIEQWNFLSDQSEIVLQKLEPHFNAGLVNDDVLIRVLGIAHIIRLTDLTEKVIKLTDELIVELSCFLIAFPICTKDYVKKSVKKKYGRILNYEIPDNEFTSNIMNHVLPFDVNEMARIQNVDVEVVKARHNYAYNPNE